MIRMNKKQSGFTILEVMVVLVIVGILAGMVATNVLDQGEDAKVKAAAAQISQIESAMNMYKLNNHRYPTTEQGLDALVTQPDIDPVPKNYPENGYMPRLPADPWDNEYLLISPGDRGRIDIFSMGPDGEAETEDDIGNWNKDEFH